MKIGVVSLLKISTLLSPKFGTKFVKVARVSWERQDSPMSCRISYRDLVDGMAIPDGILTESVVLLVA